MTVVVVLFVCEESNDSRELLITTSTDGRGLDSFLYKQRIAFGWFQVI